MEPPCVVCYLVALTKYVHLIQKLASDNSICRQNVTIPIRTDQLEVLWCKHSCFYIKNIKIHFHLCCQFQIYLR